MIIIENPKQFIYIYSIIIILYPIIPLSYYPMIIPPNHVLQKVIHGLGGHLPPWNGGLFAFAAGHGRHAIDDLEKSCIVVVLFDRGKR